MTCVWDSLMRGIRSEDWNERIGVNREQARHRPELFVDALKRLNRPTPRVSWQGEFPSEQQQRENVEWVRDYRTVGIRGGHMTSAADPFFYLLSDVLQASIVHRHRQYTMRFEPAAASRYEICVRSDGGHMSAC